LLNNISKGGHLFCYWIFSFKSTPGVTRDHLNQFDSSAPAEILRDTLENFDIRKENFVFLHLPGSFALGVTLRRFNRARVTRDQDQISGSTQRCVTCDCRFEGKNPVTPMIAKFRVIGG
jgi:hypothetical protein